MVRLKAQQAPTASPNLRLVHGLVESANALSLMEQLINSSLFTDDLLGAVALAFHGASPGQVWPIGKLS